MQKKKKILKKKKFKGSFHLKYEHFRQMPELNLRMASYIPLRIVGGPQSLKVEPDTMIQGAQRLSQAA